MNNKCFSCNSLGEEFYGYNICGECKDKLKLFTEKKVKEYTFAYPKPNSKFSSYEEEVDSRLEVMEKDYIKKRIKLLDIKHKLKDL